MPKERRASSSRLSSLRRSPTPTSSLPKDPLEDEENTKEWDDARCPVCMEHPHNAILLLCSSHDKGCRPFMCDTSYRHSNCFDQFRTSFGEVLSVLQRPEDSMHITTPDNCSTNVSRTLVSDLEGERSPETSIPLLTIPSENPSKTKQACPLCRGVITGWRVVKNARCFMNTKPRSCACEACDFNGTYTDLRTHARSVHPLVRPNDADPDRQRNWRRLERQRDLGDLFSTLHSSMGGDEDSEESTFTIDEGGWLTVFFLVRLIRPGNSSTRSRTSRAHAQLAVRRRSPRLWGETHEVESNTREEEDASESPEPVPGRTRRRVRRQHEAESNTREEDDSEPPEPVPVRTSRRVRRRVLQEDDENEPVT